MSTSCLVAVFCFLMMQSSSLWASLLLVVFSLVLMVSTTDLMASWSLFGLLFVMVFVGGLLVLLVSMSSFSFHDQSVSISTGVLFGALLVSLFYYEEKSLDSIKTGVLLSEWVSSQWQVMFMVLLILIESMVMITTMLMWFKGSLRLY